MWSALISDDDEFFRAALSEILIARLGFSEAIETGSFDEAVECLDGQSGKKAVGLAMFDLSMPGISNPSNLRSVREMFPDVTVIVVSASDRRGDILSSLEAGVHGYVPKALGIGELERAVRRVLEGDIYVPSLLADVNGAPGDTRKGGNETTAIPGGGGQLPELTPRQKDVLGLIVGGKSNKEIARALGLGEGTVKVHMAALFRNLGVTNRTAAAAAAAPYMHR